MHIKLKSGKEEVEISGTPDQVREFAADWRITVGPATHDPKTVQYLENYTTMCKMLRSTAEQMALGMKDKPILDVCRELLKVLGTYETEAGA